MGIKVAVLRKGKGPSVGCSFVRDDDGKGKLLGRVNRENLHCPFFNSIVIFRFSCFFLPNQFVIDYFLPFSSST